MFIDVDHKLRDSTAPVEPALPYLSARALLPLCSVHNNQSPSDTLKCMKRY